MNSCSRLTIFVAALIMPLFATQVSAQLEVEIDFDGSVQPAIVDNGAGDLNPTDDIIDFDITDTVNTDLSARGRVHHETGAIGQSVEFTAITPDANGVLRNAGAAPADFTLTMRSPTYGAIGPPLGWALWHHGEVADPLPDVVAVTNHSSTLSVDNEVVPRQTVLVPDIADVGDPPILIDDDLAPVGRGSDPAADATSTQAVLSVTLGPGDEYRSQTDIDGFGEFSFFAHVFNQELKCVIKMNQQAGKAFKNMGKVDEKCVKAADKSPALACVEDPGAAKDELTEAKLAKFFGFFCVVPPPVWGAHPGACCEDSVNEGAECADNTDCTGGACTLGACIAGAQAKASNGLVRDLFSSAVDVNTSERCTTGVHKAADKAVSARWKVFFNCEKENIKLKSILNDIDLVTQCLAGTETSDSSVADLEAGIIGAVGDCSTPVALAFPGRCKNAGAGFGDCVIARTRCRFCQSANEADDIVPPFNCDLFDNVIADLSCADDAFATTTTTTTTLTTTTTDTTTTTL